MYLLYLFFVIDDGKEYGALKMETESYAFKRRF